MKALFTDSVIDKKRMMIKILLIVALFIPIMIAKKFYGMFLILWLLLFLLSECSRKAFLFTFLLVILAEIPYVHVVHHWGGKAFDARLEVALASPLYEIQEYLRSYVDLVDLLALLYLSLLLYLAYRFSGKALRFTIGRPFCIAMLLLFFLLAKNVPPGKFYKELYRSFSRNELLTQRLEKVREYSKDPNIDSSRYDRVVIVMGESASRHHFGLYGYKRDTNPFLSKTKAYAFKAIAPTNQTRLSVPLILGDTDLHHWPDFYETPSLVTLLGRAGYETCWVSNQRARGKNDTNSASLAHEAKRQVFLNQGTRAFSAKDQVVVDYLEKMRVPQNKKLACFIHLMGSHKRYASRYDPSRVPFGEKDLIDRYDNSIYYTDLILAKIYERFREKRLLMIYLSDHAEIVSKGGGHGFDPPFRDEFDVPFVVLSTIPNPYLEKMKRHYEKHPINLDDLPCFVRNILAAREVCTPENSHDVIAVTPRNLYNYDSLKNSRVLPTLKSSRKNHETAGTE